jgi:hypothetical protein
MRSVAYVIIGLFMVLASLFTVMWYDHTGYVQNMVRDDIVVYKSNQFDWLGMVDEPKDVIAETALKAIGELIPVMGGYEGSYDVDERNAYRDSLYRLITTLHSDLSNSHIDDALLYVEFTSEQWLGSVHKFLNNRFYAMQYTF